MMHPRSIIILVLAIFILTLIPTQFLYSESGTNRIPVQIYTVSIQTMDARGYLLSPSNETIVVSDSSRPLYSGPIPPNGIFHLPTGLYSFSVYDSNVGYNAIMYAVKGNTNLTLILMPMSVTVIDTKTGTHYNNIKNPYQFLQIEDRDSNLQLTQAVFGPPPFLNNTYTSSSQYVAPQDTCHHYWVLTNVADLGNIPQLQGAVYSYYKNSSYQIVNSPTVSQYSQVDTYVSINAGPVSVSAQTSYSVQTTEQLPKASYSSGLWNYDVYMQAHWYDNVYRLYDDCSGQYTSVQDDFYMGQGSNFYQYDNSATSTSDYSFSYFMNFAIGAQQSNTIGVTLSEISTFSVSFGSEAQLTVSSSETGGGFSGSFNIAGSTSLNQWTSGNTVMYTLTGYGYCKGYQLYRSGWVLGFSSGTPSC
jgi:hypothetical protein